MRAFAVLSVIANHLTGKPAGGFVGVDIFFVISGFLITGLLVREHERTGRISFTGFYRRRVKRILPASLLTLATTIAVSHFVFLRDRWISAVVDGVWAACFGANWRFQAQSTDYFARGGPTSPFQHFWSLSIEEQFYFVWPWLMLFIFSVLVARPHLRVRPRVVVFAAISVISLASFGWAVAQSQSNAASAYFSTFTRVWELGVGATLAVATPMLRRIPDIARPLLAWVGLAGMVASLFVVTGTRDFPAPAAALPVLSTALVIAAGTFARHRRQASYLWPLTNRASEYVGDISYSLYLWHFPVIVVFGALMTTGTSRYYLACLFATAVVSVASFHFVEDPVRRSTFLEPKAIRRARGPIWDIRERRRMRALAATLGMAATVGLIAASVHQPAPPRSVKLKPVASDGLQAQVGPKWPPYRAAGPKAAKYASLTRSALTSTEWPSDLRPALDKVGKDWMGSAYEGCLNTVAGGSGCRLGSGAERIAVLGDSLAGRLLMTLHDVFPSATVYGVARAACPAVEVAVTFDSSKDRLACEQHRNAGFAYLRRQKPDYVFIMDNAGLYRNLADGAEGDDGVAEWKAGMVKTIRATGVAPSRVVIVSPPPEGDHITQCATLRSRPADCVTTVPDEWKSASYAEYQAARATGARYVNTLGWFCYATTMQCPAYVDSTVEKIDNVHPTTYYLHKIAPLMTEALGRQGIATG